MGTTPIGRLNKRAALQSATATTDGQGGRAKVWATFATVWALVEPLSGREALNAAQVTATYSTGVTIWYRADVSVKQRLVVEGRTLQIDSVQDPTGLKDELRLLCTEVQA